MSGATADLTAEATELVESVIARLNKAVDHVRWSNDDKYLSLSNARDALNGLIVNGRNEYVFVSAMFRLGCLHQAVVSCEQSSIAITRLKSEMNLEADRMASCVGKMIRGEWTEADTGATN